MAFVEKIDIDSALKEVNDFLDKKNMYPKRREALQPMIEVVSEAIQYGQVSIDETGAITQELLSPILDKNGEPALLRLEFKARISPDVIAAKIKTAKAVTQDDRIMVYTNAYTGEPAMMINKLESTDRNTCDAITLFLI